MFIHTAFQVAGYPDVKRSILFAGENIGGSVFIFHMVFLHSTGFRDYARNDINRAHTSPCHPTTVILREGRAAAVVAESIILDMPNMNSAIVSKSI